MKKLFILSAALSLTLNAFAGCGKTETTEGKVKSFDAEKKVLVVQAKGGKDASITLTPTTSGADKAADLVGKKVKVVTSHGKATSIEKA